MSSLFGTASICPPHPSLVSLGGTPGLQLVFHHSLAVLCVCITVVARCLCFVSKIKEKRGRGGGAVKLSSSSFCPWFQTCFRNCHLLWVPLTTTCCMLFAQCQWLQKLLKHSEPACLTASDQSAMALRGPVIPNGPRTILMHIGSWPRAGVQWTTDASL